MIKNRVDFYFEWWTRKALGAISDHSLSMKWSYGNELIHLQPDTDPIAFPSLRILHT